MGFQFNNIRGHARKINWTLLLFLILVLNVKMLVKIFAIIILLLINRKMLFDKKIYREKFIWFYVILIGIAIVNALINISALSLNYAASMSLGILGWLLCTAASLLVYRYVSTTPIENLRNTVELFFILNFAVTVAQLILIMWDAGTINPYTYQGMYQKYFINTGDRLTGLTFDISTTNAVINSFGVFYFLYSRKIHFVLLCMAGLLLTASNYTNIIVGFILLLIFLFRSTRIQKSIIVVCLALLAIFMARVSPQNKQYLEEEFSEMLNVKKDNGTRITGLSRPTENTQSPEETKHQVASVFIDSLSREKAIKDAAIAKNEGVTSKPAIPVANIHSAPFQRNRALNSAQKKLLAFTLENFPEFDTNPKAFISGRIPGKLKAFRQTFEYLGNHPVKILTGAGTGNFASKLAFRTTGLNISGGYPPKFIYINDAFLNNHLYLYLFYFSRDTPLHSLINNPNSVYDQLIAEYGVAGILAFIIFYLLVFLKVAKKLSYGLPALVLLLVMFGMDYWFEQLSIVILFELLMLLNIKEIHANDGGSKSNSADASV